MKSFFIILSLLQLMLFGNMAQGQDERYYRKMVTGDLLKDVEKASAPPRYVYAGPVYRYDLNGDGVEESLQVEKRDGIDWLILRDSSEREIFSGKLWAMGADAWLYRARIVDLSKNARAILLYLYEGRTASVRFEATARLYVLSFENRDLSKITFMQGPHFFHEKEAMREQYWVRNYNVNVVDLDNDGVRDIAVQYNKMTYSMLYKGDGKWISY